MTLNKINGFTKRVSDLPDVPQMSSAELKNYFDSSPDEIKTAFNALIDALQSTAAGNSGASNIKLETISGLTAADVQAAIKSLSDNKTNKTGDHAGTWAGYTPQNFPLDITREQMFFVTDPILNGQSGDRYPVGVSLMVVSNDSSWPASVGLVVTFKSSGLRLTQHFYRIGANSTDVGMWFRHWYNTAWTPWQIVATNTTVQAQIDAKVKVSKIQSGTIYMDIPANSSKTVTITFPEAFDTDAITVATTRNSNLPDTYPAPVTSGQTNTSVKLTAKNNSGGTTTLGYNWIATN